MQPATAATTGFSSVVQLLEAAVLFLLFGSESLASSKEASSSNPVAVVIVIVKLTQLLFPLLPLMSPVVKVLPPADCPVPLHTEN